MKQNKTGKFNDDRQVFRYHSYNLHYACFSCRKMFNEPPWIRRQDRKGALVNVIACPQCKLPMCNMGKEFKPPRRNDVRQWRKVEMLYKRGYRWETKFQQVWTTQGNTKIGRSMLVSRSPHAKTLRDARTDYQPIAKP